MGKPRVWVLLGGRKGDNNQLLALAGALGWPFEAKPLRYNRLRLLSKRLLGPTLAVLDEPSRQSLGGPLPDFVLASGHRSVPVVRALQDRSGGRLQSVHIGNPRVSPRHFGLVVTTPQYPVPDGPNVLRLPISLSPPAKLAKARGKRPTRLLALGGPTAFWRLDEEALAQAVRTLSAAATKDGGRLVISASPRTPPALSKQLQATTTPFADLLAEADEVFVTADSVAMISEAIATGKPVGIIPVRPTAAGRIALAVADALGRPAFPRDLRRFWAGIDRLGLAGTVEAPRRGDVPDVLAQAVARVKSLALPQ
ncbi:nucleoside-diphosphate sugar epimerase [Sphingomonas sinipercae]|uniref:Nucleoside-diphosphate sugar epimerase n=1 Tax=Sphingomonas sinipercae TaxID=2714944 RepID=A0A6G7ZP47_9SPHN|nr:ELM1/GtrOC1 family putative glycosyltransferase [Sphingomonas sinipercae]QIL02676.1 nucleoside-diphosphate sugar epimerase [Sphingomonas sinipercae]